MLPVTRELGLAWQENDGPAHDVPPTRPSRTIDCPNCGLVQHGPECMRNETLYCCRCKTSFAHRTWKSLDVALACSVGILLLLIPALAEPFLTTSALGATRTSVLPMSSSFLWREGWPFLAIAVFLFVLSFPILRFTALGSVLFMLRSNTRPPWLGTAFRLSIQLQTWAMLDVFLLGLAVAYARLHASLQVSIDAGAMCFVAAALLTLVTRATLDTPLVWRMIAPDRNPAFTEPTVMCSYCHLLLPQDCEGRRCPRCTGVVRRRRSESVPRAMALLLAAMLLYFPANLYPIATIPIDLKPTAYTVIGGVIDLSKSHLLGLALLVFCASFTIPILKMLGLSWCVLSVLRRSDRHLLAKTRVYRVIEEIGRWSMVDPLTIACFVPVLHFNALIDGRAEPAATPFAAVAILTTLAVRAFDPRLMWDVAGNKR
jgi:paraquat-inducible protein A